MNDDEYLERTGLRVLRFLAPGAAKLRAASDGATHLLDAGERGTIGVKASTFETLRRGRLVDICGDVVAISATGLQQLDRERVSRDPLAARRPDVELRQVSCDEGDATVVANLAESPLGAIARRRGKDGRPFLDGVEVDAGEKLRMDYERGRIMPRLGANWQAPISSGGRGGAGGMVDLTDTALAARQRVDQALAAVGPELSGVLVDVCCFLKGVELVEAERGWPVRSAKIVLKTALGALARHYFPDRLRPRGPSRPLHWGADDYRPSIS